MTTNNEVHDLVTRVSLLEEKLRTVQVELDRITEENKANNGETRDRLTKVEGMVNDLKLNTALTKQALEAIQDLAKDMKDDRASSHQWRSDQDAKWNKIAGAKWVVGLLVALVVAFSESGQHLVHAIQALL